MKRFLVFFKVAVHASILHIFVRDGWRIAALVERHGVIQGILHDSIIFTLFMEIQRRRSLSIPQLLHLGYGFFRLRLPSRRGFKQSGKSVNLYNYFRLWQFLIFVGKKEILVTGHY